MYPSLSVPEKFVAIVGDNGAGKSTLIKLVCRFSMIPCPVSSALTAGRCGIFRNMSTSTGLGVLFQDFTRYFYSVRENIWFGDVDKNRDGERVRNAARKVEADGFLSALNRWL